MQKLLLGDPVSEYLDNKSSMIFENYEREEGKKATLGAITVGDDPASMLYVGRKQEKAKILNVDFHWKKIGANASIQEVEESIRELSILNGIILQLPIPSHLNQDQLVDLIPSELDVDGLNSRNLGTLFDVKPKIIPATARAIIELFDYYKIDLSGKDIAVIGRSRLVTAPLARLLSTERYNATVTVLHSKSSNLNFNKSKSDIVISAVGKAYFLNHSNFKEGAIVIDVGISKKNNKSYGDVDPLNTDEILYARSPFPGGVGPITVSALYSNLAKLIS